MSRLDELEQAISAASRRVMAAREADFRSRVWVEGECRRTADELRAAELAFDAAVRAKKEEEARS